MKKILFLFLFLLITAMPAMAEEQNICEEVAGFAQLVMETRQNGADISKMLEIANSFDGNFKKAFIKMIIEAYEVPQYSGIKYQNQETKRFKEKYYISCLKSSQ